MRRPWLATEGITAAWSVVVCDTFSGGTESRRSFLGPCPVIYLSIYLRVTEKRGEKANIASLLSNAGASYVYPVDYASEISGLQSIPLIMTYSYLLSLSVPFIYNRCSLRVP